MKITIIGAGIGGLALAAALRHHGMQAQVFERASKLRAVGAGIGMPPNAMQAFATFGLADSVAAAGYGLDKMSIETISGTSLQRIDWNQVEAEFAYRGVLLHRADLQRVLASAVPDEWVHLGRGAVGLSQTSEGVDIQLSDGTVERADIVVGADGLRSVVRDFLFPVPLRYSGQSCLWGVANLTLDSTLQRHALELWGGDQRFGFAPLRSTSGEGSDRVYWFAPFRSREGLPRPDNARQFLRSHWRAFPEPVGSIIDATPEELILHTDLYDIRPLPKWWKGRTLLLGDAAHATTPNLGQGGAQAIEDAAVLSRLLRALRGDPSDIEACFRKFQAIRHPKTTHITKQAWSLGKMAHWSQPLLCGVRNIAVTSMPAALMRRQMKVLFSHERGEATANSGTP